MTSSQSTRRRKNKKGRGVDKLLLADLVDKKTLVKVQNSYLDYLQSSAAIIDADGKYLIADIVSPYCKFLNQAVSKKIPSSLKKQDEVPKKYLCHHDCHRLSLKAMKTKLPCTGECHGGITVLAAPVMINGEVWGCINAGIANPPAEDKRIKRIARKFNVDPQKLLNVANRYAPRPDYLFESAKKHIVREAEAIAGACERKMLDVQVREMTLKLEKREEKRVLDEAKKYRSLLEHVSDGIIVADQDGKITFFNKRAEKMLGYDAKEIEGKDVFSIVPQKYRNGGKKARNNFLKTGASNSVRKAYEAAALRKNGFEVPVEISLNAFKTAGSINFVASLRDIAGRKEAELRIRETRNFLEQVFETSMDGILVNDEKGAITFVNSAIEMMTGYKRDELIGQHVSMLVSRTEEDQKAGQQKMEEVMEKGKLSFEVVWSRKDGTPLIVEQSSAITKDEKGNITGGVSVVRDIGERKKAENELRETKDFMENVIEASVDGIIIMDGIGNIISVNSAIEKITGIKRKELIGTHISQFTPLDDKERKKIRATLMEDFFEKGYARFDYTWQKENGNIVEMEQISNLVKDEQGNGVAAISIVRDITERRKSEKETKEARDFLVKVIENSLDGIIINDAKGNIISVNESMEKMLGFKKEELLGQHISFFTPPDKKSKDRVVAELLPKLFSEGKVSYESVLQNKEGVLINMDLSSA